MLSTNFCWQCGTNCPQWRSSQRSSSSAARCRQLHGELLRSVKCSIVQHLPSSTVQLCHASGRLFVKSFNQRTNVAAAQPNRINAITLQFSS
jgi:hypothetical protein